jgi:5'-nucleotidase / UDP-sugar diphosphatase
LAQNVPGIDVIITGHAHKGTPEALISNGTLIVSTDALGIELGRLDITYNKKSDKITAHKNNLQVVYDDEIKDDEQTQAAINNSKEKLSIITSQHVCDISENLTRSYGEESFLGNMVADAILFSKPTADFALTNSGGLREDILGPKVSVGALISAFPFPNTVVEMDLKGNDLQEIFEHGATLKNGILQVSKGIEMSYDETLPMEKRVKKLLNKGEAIDPKKSYRVVTNNFLADGGDGFLAFKNGTNKKNTQIPILETLVKYLKTFETFTPKIEGRVVKEK